MYFRMDQLLLLEHLTYLHNVTPLRSILDCNGYTVREILDSIDESQLISDKNYGSFITGKDWMDLFLAMEQDSDILQTRVLDTHIDHNQGGGGGISIVLVNDEKKEAIVAFRGTAPAEWADDILGANVISTVQQENALSWYREVYALHTLSDYYVTIIGHSKGANKAKFITILDDTPDRCVAFDGQGFSDTFFREYKDRIIKRQSVIENHNIDYDYVNILLNDVGTRYYYKGYDYGRGGLAESHCPNTFFEFGENGQYQITLNESGQSSEMQELDRFVNSIIRSHPSEEEIQDTTQLLGLLVERAFNLKYTGETTADYINYLCELVSSEQYCDNVAYLCAFIILYDRKNPGFLDRIAGVLDFFNMTGFGQYVRMVKSLMLFPGLDQMISVAGFFANRLPDKVFLSMQKYIQDRFQIGLSKEQIKGMLYILRGMKESLKDTTITDSGLDLNAEEIQE